MNFLLLFLFLIFLNIIIHFIYVEYYREKVFSGILEHKFKDRVKLPDVERSYTIPHVIYRTHGSPEKTAPYKKVIERSEKISPGFETRIFYDEDMEKYIKSNFSERIYNAYKSINDDFGPAKADFFRYLVIYKEGGIYLDIKSGIVKPIDKLVDSLKGKLAISNWTSFPIGYIPLLHIDEMYWGSFFENSYGEYQQWFVLSGKGNPILGEIIERMVLNLEFCIAGKNRCNFGKESVVSVTGPVMFTNTIEKSEKKDEYKIFSPDLDGCLRYKAADHKKIEGKNHYTKSHEMNIVKRL